MMKKLYLILFAGLLIPLMGCPPECTTHNGYLRLSMQVNCEKVIIEGTTYDLTLVNNDLVIDHHTLYRGIYRKTHPWLYVHHIEGNVVDVTFDIGSKEDYPLYTGCKGAIGEVYAHPWELGETTIAGFQNSLWLLAHRWTSNGIFFDLQKGSGVDWTLVKPDIFVPGNGTEVIIQEIQTKLKVNSFNASQKKAVVAFTRL